MTAYVAKQLKRNYIGCEIDETYYKSNLITEKNIKKEKKKSKKGKKKDIDI